MYLRFHSIDQYRPMNIIIDEDSSTNEGALWLGDYTAAQDRNTLKQKNIRTVLTVAAGLNISYPSNANIIHRTYNILDIESANIKRIWSETFTLINEGLQRGSVLIHCAAGVSRSASTVIAYIMKKRGWGFNEAFNFVKKRRPIICPNYGFQRQLRQYERELTTNEPISMSTQFTAKKTSNPETNSHQSIKTDLQTMKKGQYQQFQEIPKTAKKSMTPLNERSPFTNQIFGVKQQQRNRQQGIFNQKLFDDYATFEKSTTNNYNIFKKPTLTAQKLFNNNNIRLNKDQFKQ